MILSNSSLINEMGRYFFENTLSPAVNATTSSETVFSLLAQLASSEVQKSITQLNIPKIFEVLTKELNQAMVNSAQNIAINKTFSQLGSNFAEGMSGNSNLVLDSINKIIGNFSANMFSNLAEVASTNVQRSITSFNLSKIVEVLIRELNQVLEGSAQNITVGKTLSYLGENLATGIDGSSKPIIEATHRAVGHFFQGMALNTIPYLAIGMLSLTGPPLAMLYLYHKAKYHIGVPLLDSEEEKTGCLQRIRQRVSRIARGSLKSIASGIKWGSGTAIGCLAAYIPTRLICSLSQNYEEICVQSNSNYMGLSVHLVTVVALIALGYSIASNSYHAVRNTLTVLPDPKPIFKQSVAIAITEIAESTYNLKTNGGFFQHLFLYGPGGTGKTLVANSIIEHSKMNRISISGGNLAQYIKRGEHVSRLNAMFKEINDRSTATILFIDELESLARDRNQIDKSELLELLNAFLSHTGKETNKFMLIAATNMPHLIDKAALDRFDHKLYIGLPETEEREQILDQDVKRFFKDSESDLLNKNTIKSIAMGTEGLTGRALSKMINAIWSKKMMSRTKKLTQEMIDSAVRHFVVQEQRIRELCIRA